MERTISIMVGKGSYSHNRRSFVAKNVDGKRTVRNVVFKDEKIRDVYYELFDAAQQRYNDKQKRKDRKIANYYEKIRTSKQEKLYHEIIVQIGNKDDMNAQSVDGIIAKHTLEDYMKGFEARNPKLRVFGAYLHMDEETPHLHIDFVPYITGSKRGMDTRVSLKAALEAQGFRGNSRGNTEWKQWVESEKIELEAVMKRHGIQWLKKGTHEKHLSVLDFEKRERAKEVKQLEAQIDEKRAEFCDRQKWINQQFDRERFIRKEIEEKKEELAEVQSEVENAKDKLADIHADVVSEKVIRESLSEETSELRKQKHNLQVDVIGLYEAKEESEKEYADYAELSQNFNEVARRYEDGWEYKLQEPTGLMSAKSYKEKFVEPLLVRLSNLMGTLINMLKGLQYRVSKAERENHQLWERIRDKDRTIEYQEQEIERLEKVEEKYDAVVEELGEDVVEEIVERGKESEFERQYDFGSR